MEVFINFAFRRQIQQGWVNIEATLGQLKYFARIGQILRRLTRSYGLKDQENGQQSNFQAVLLVFLGEGRGNRGLYVEAGIENQRTAHSRHWLPAGMPKRFNKVKVGFLRAFK